MSLDLIIPNSLADYINLVVLVVAIIAMVICWKFYAVTRSGAIMIIAIAMDIGVATRILVYLGLSTYSPYTSIVYWVLWTVGLYKLLVFIRGKPR